ncbi:hypothetical protein BDQ17DRAFT_1430992 [Cyathus striatus]|nr:hypothetical protein BDQ17DRAFT_1430992 [Cyathus striatus]
MSERRRAEIETKRAKLEALRKAREERVKADAERKTEGSRTAIARRNFHESIDELIGTGARGGLDSRDLTPSSSIPGYPALREIPFPGPSGAALSTSLSASGSGRTSCQSDFSSESSPGATLAQSTSSATDNVIEHVMIPRIYPDLIHIEQELFEFPQKERLLYNKEIQTIAVETEPLTSREDEDQERQAKERDLEAEPAAAEARDRELEEESVKLKQEIEQEIRELSEEERASILAAPEFAEFVEQSSKILQRALNDGYDMNLMASNAAFFINFLAISLKPDIRRNIFWTDLTLGYPIEALASTEDTFICCWTYTSGLRYADSGWLVDMLAQPQETLELIHAGHNKTGEVAITCLDFPPNETTTFWVGTEEGNVYQANRYDRAGAKAGLNQHDVYKDFSDLFLTSSVDWTDKLWRAKSLAKPSTSHAIAPVYSFDEADDYVCDVKWHPNHPGLFGMVDGSGKFDRRNLNTDTEVLAVSTTVGSGRAINKLQWDKKEGRRAALGGSDGRLYIYDIGDMAIPRESEWTDMQKTLAGIVGGGQANGMAESDSTKVATGR